MKKTWIWIIVGIIALITVLYADDIYHNRYTHYLKKLLLMQGTAQIDFNTAGSGETINSSTSNQLDIDADTEVEIGTATLDINASTAISLGGPATFDTTIFAASDGAKVFSAGSYSSKVTLASGATTEMVTIAGQGDEDDFYIGYGSYIRTTGEDGRGFGIATLVEATNTTGTSTLQGGQLMTFLGTVGGTEAAVLKSASGDATAGMYNLWLKSGANDNVVLASGSKTANLWLDNSMSGNLTDNGAEVYSAYITAGGMKLDAVFGMESGTLGWSALFYFDETCYNKDPISAETTDNTGNDSDGTIIFNLNGTLAYVPFFYAAKLN